VVTSVPVTVATIIPVISMVNMLPTGLVTMVAAGYHSYSISVVALVSLPVHKLSASHFTVGDCRQFKSTVYILGGLRWHDIHSKICQNLFNSSPASRTTCREHVWCQAKYCIELAQNRSKYITFANVGERGRGI
jgi:hypothetical protein